MKFLCAAAATLIMMLAACGGGDKKAGNDGKGNTGQTTGGNKDANAGAPEIDTSNLNDGAAILKTLKEVVDARMADEKKKKEDPNYSGYYLELMSYYNAVLGAQNRLMDKMQPEQLLEFKKRADSITAPMYAK